MISRKYLSSTDVIFPLNTFSLFIGGVCRSHRNGEPSSDDEGRKSSPHPSGWHVRQRHWGNEFQSGEFNSGKDQVEMLRNHWGVEFEWWEEGERRVEDEWGLTSTALEQSPTHRVPFCSRAGVTHTHASWSSKSSNRRVPDQWWGTF